MALFEVPRPANSVDRIRFFASHVGSMISAWNDQRRTRNTLSELSNAQLNDLGLSRGDIDRIAGSGRIF